MDRIPKKLHLYWGRNKKLSFLKYLTAFSFAKQNPDWKINVWYPSTISKRQWWTSAEQKSHKWEGEDYFPLLGDIEGVTYKEFDFKTIGIRGDTPEVIKSDVLRLHLLAKEGGVWSDFDILYYRPMEDVQLGDKRKIAFVCRSNTKFKYFYIGFMMSTPNNNIFLHLFKRAVEKVNKGGGGQYQIAGNTVFREIVGNPKRKFDPYLGYIDPHTVYLFPPTEIHWLFGETITVGNRDDSGIGVHWYAGDKEASKVENVMTPANINKFNSVVGRLAKEVYN